VNPEGALKLMKVSKSSKKRLFWYKDGFHDLVREGYWEEFLDKVIEWILINL